MIEILCVRENASMWDVLRSQQRAAEAGLPAGLTIVTDENGVLKGVITDGDIRRALLKNESLTITAGEAMVRSPILFPDGMSYSEIMRRLPSELEKRGRRSRRFLGKIVLIDHAGRPTRVLEYHELWEQRVATHRHIVVVGQGYVGLTLSLILAKEGFRVTGVEADTGKASQLASGHSHVHELGIQDLLREELRSNFKISTSVPDDSDIFVIAVGTPLPLPLGEGRAKRGVRESHPPKPVLDHLSSAVDSVSRKLRPGSLVVLRSTMPVGTTREIVKPILEKNTGLRAGADFHLAVAPERTVEGKALQELRTLPQIIGGINLDSVEATAALFREITPAIVRVESLEAAEMAKLINNSFRDLSFAFANQMAVTAAAYNLDIVEVIRAANRGYSRNPVPLPSPGVGGACLTKDPYILSTSLSLLAREINESMPQFVVDSVIRELKAAGKSPSDCSVLICGLAFKGDPETSDIRSSTSLDIIRLLEGQVKTIHVHDPVVPMEELQWKSVQLPAGFAGQDVALFLNNHPSYAKLDIFSAVRAMNARPLIFDGWSLFSAEDVLNACPSIYAGVGFVRKSV